jgi:hypothetical protein
MLTITFQKELDFTQIIIATLTLISIFVIFCFNRAQIKQLKKQFSIQIDQIKQGYFADYTKRYQEIILHFPENINTNSFNLNIETNKDQIMRCLRVYFDLCSEEFFLHRNGYIDDKVWTEWEAGMVFAFSKPAFIQAWEIIKTDTGFYTEFGDFVDAAMKKESYQSQTEVQPE